MFAFSFTLSLSLVTTPFVKVNGLKVSDVSDIEQADGDGALFDTNREIKIKSTLIEREEIVFRCCCWFFI